MTTNGKLPKSTASADSSSDPILFNGGQTLSDIDKFLSTETAHKLAAWVQTEHERAKQARSQRQIQWQTNMAFMFGKQDIEITSAKMGQYGNQLRTPVRPYYAKKKTINRTRAIVRSELSKFLSNVPNAVAVPATADDEDTRSAYAAEQAWRSISDAQKLRTHYSRAAWWMIITGNGFIKSWWDNDALDRASGEQGAIRYGNVTPFHLFIPDLREQDVEDQPFIINAYVKSEQWCKRFWGEKMTGMSPSQSSQPIVEDGHLNLSAANNRDSYVVYETWIKPGGCEYLPEGGVVVSVDDRIIDITEGFPYDHGMYPFTKFEHIPSGTFYADSPLVDSNPLQREYNQLRSEISEIARRMGRPQILAQKGSIVPAKVTNEPGLIIEYLPGFSPPQAVAPVPLPSYYVEQQDRVLSDIEEITGQFEASKGQAPAGVTAGTAISYLQEKNNQFFTPQYQSIEDGYERIAQQTVGLFVQYVDMPRKVKTVGADGAFDTMILQGSDLKNGTDLRVEQGSAIGESQAAKEARVMDMFSMGLIPQDMALKLLEVGGAQKLLDIISVAEKKAQRENLKMKKLAEGDIAQHDEQFEMQLQQQLMTGQPVATEEPSEELPVGAVPEPTEDPYLDPEYEEPEIPETPPVVRVDDFDIHEVHLETHHIFMMSQEYEVLPEAVKQQFVLHCAIHQQSIEQKALMSFLDAIPSDGSDGQSDDMTVQTGGEEEAPVEEPAGPDTMADNGAVPAPPEPTGV